MFKRKPTFIQVDKNDAATDKCSPYYPEHIVEQQSEMISPIHVNRQLFIQTYLNLNESQYQTQRVRNRRQGISIEVKHLRKINNSNYYTKVNFNKEQSKYNIQCCICLLDFENKEQVAKMMCMHQYHLDCIESWINTSDQCPLCKKNIVDN